MKLFVEGGGMSKALRTECREAFKSWLQGIGLKEFPRIVASGSRNDAFNDFKTALNNGEIAILLVDSEGAVDAMHQAGPSNGWLPWAHLKARDHWDAPANSKDCDCHLMVQCMENWFLGDPNRLADFFGQKFNASKLPSTHPSLEAVEKTKVLKQIQTASAKCTTKGQYGKGKHSFKILKLLDANLVIANAPWANRFADEMKMRFP